MLLNLLRRIDRSRFSPELCCLKELGELGEQLQRDIPVHERLLRNKFDIRVLWRLTRLLRNREIDAVITVGAGDKMFWGRLAAKRAGVPVVISALHSTGWPDCITWLNRRLTPLTDAFIAVAEKHAKYLVEHENLPSGRVVVIPNGVDTDRFQLARPTADVRQQLGIPHSAPLVGIVAVLRPEKNHEMFLRVAARVRRDVVEAHFLIIGDGPRRPELELLAAQLGLSDCVHFLGKRFDVPELLGLLDVFVLTSHNEANPVSILEALATGKPVVSTAVGSIPETVLEGVTGYLVDPGDELPWLAACRSCCWIRPNPNISAPPAAGSRRSLVAGTHGRGLRRIDRATVSCEDSSRRAIQIESCLTHSVRETQATLPPHRQVRYYLQVRIPHPQHRVSVAILTWICTGKHSSGVFFSRSA